MTCMKIKPVHLKMIQMKDMSLWNLSFTKKDLSDALWFDATQ